MVLSPVRGRCLWQSKYNPTFTNPAYSNPILLTVVYIVSYIFIDTGEDDLFNTGAPAQQQQEKQQQPAGGGGGTKNTSMAASMTGSLANKSMSHLSG